MLKMNRQFNHKQSGFTLIELIVVIVILGILAATALPKFIDLSTEAKAAKAAGVAGAIASSAAIRFAASKANPSSYPYVVGDACTGSYLETTIPTGCFGTGTTSCTVTCDSVAASPVALPS